MKKITKWFFGVLCVCSVMSTGFLTIAASADTVTIAEEIFPNEQVDEIEKEILMRTVYDDKDKEGKFFVAQPIIQQDQELFWLLLINIKD